MQRNKTTGIVVMILTVATAMMSCNRKTVYDHYEPTQVEGWERNDTLTFGVSPLRESGIYREEVGLRINTEYPFTGLSLIVEQTVLPSGATRNDTLNCRLMTADGKVWGHGVSSYQYRFHMADVSLKQGDSLHISVRHNMKREILPGISDVGIRMTGGEVR